jgi:hypothetical protein
MRSLGLLVRTLLVLASIVWGLPAALIGQQCDGTLWNHVYHQNRFIVHNPCVTVTGTIVLVRPETDGDLHIQLRLDPPYSFMLNSANQGNLVIEPICVSTPSPGDAFSACGVFRQHIQIPAVGTHVIVTGTFVLDQKHGWNEIHPITGMAVR